MENQRPQLHVTPPLAEGTTIPEKSPTQKAIEKANAKIVAAREKKDKLNASKATTKRAGEEDSDAPRRKRARKNQKIANSGSEGTIFITPLRQASPKFVEEGVSSSPKATAGTVAGGTHPLNTEKEVIELSENTCLPTPPVISATQPSLHARTGPSPDGVAFSDANSIHSIHQGEGGISGEHQFVPGWGLRDDMRVSSVRACKEMITYLATLTENKFLRSLSNMDLVRRAYQFLGKSDVQLEELNRLRDDLQRETQKNDGLTK
ncbi:hypothetical protein Tco_1558503 [Tanacetum coccineum]